MTNTELQNMLPYDLENLIEEATKILNEKSSTTKTHHECIRTRSPESCPICGSKHFVKNGKHEGVQRYLCKDCKKTFGNTNNTFLYHTQISYNTWITFIQCEILRLTLTEESQMTGLSVTTCFAMRHKLHEAMSRKRKSVKLKGDIQTDFMYRSINLKGTLPSQYA